MKNFSLENHPKIQPGFKLPEEPYFDSFFEKIASKINHSATKSISMHKQKRIWFATIAATLIFGFLINNDYQNNITKQLAEEFLVTDNSLSIYEITEQLTDEDITTLEQQIITHKT